MVRFSVLRVCFLAQMEHGCISDLVPEEYEICEGSADFTGRICVIGSELKEEALKELFEV